MPQTAIFPAGPLATAAATALVATGRATGVAVGTGLRAVVMAIFFQGLASVNDAQAGLTGAFHLGNAGHIGLRER